MPEMCQEFTSKNCAVEPMITAVNGVYRSVTITPTYRCITADHLMTATQAAIRHILTHCLAHGDKIKAFTATKVMMRKINFTDGSIDKEDAMYFTNKAAPIQSESCIDEFLNNVGKKLQSSIENFTNKGSNWIVSSIENIALRLVRYQLPRGGDADTFVLPPELAAKKCVINIDAPANECFKYSIVAALHNEKIDDGNRNKHRRTNYDGFFPQYNFNGINFPSTAEDIVAFMKNNKTIAINALEYTPATKKKPAKVSPIYHPSHSKIKDQRLINILFIKDHWLPIINLDRLLGDRLGNAAYCYRCLRNLHRPERLEAHMLKCYNSKGQQVSMPEPHEAKKQFDDWSKMLSPPFTMYADIEAILEKPQDDGSILQIHKPCAVGSYIVPHKDLHY